MYTLIVVDAANLPLPESLWYNYITCPLGGYLTRLKGEKYG
jgi:hypothetical protein